MPRDRLVPGRTDPSASRPARLRSAQHPSRALLASTCPWYIWVLESTNRVSFFRASEMTFRVFFSIAVKSRRGR